MTEALDIEKVRAFFKDDKFATICLGATIDSFDVDPHRATVSMDLDMGRHANAQGFVQGGVFMSLCDFALAVCSNAGQVPCCSTNHSMECMSRAKGNRLIAHATCTKEGRTLCFYVVELTDELGTKVGRMTATCMRTPQVQNACK